MKETKSLLSKKIFFFNQKKTDNKQETKNQIFSDGDSVMKTILKRDNVTEWLRMGWGESPRNDLKKKY